MSNITTFDLITGSDIICEEICTIRQPKLKYIKNIGYQEYNQFLTVISINLNNLIESIGIKEFYESLKEEEKKNYTVFNLLISQRITRELLYKALSFFICENIIFDEANMCFLLFKGYGEWYEFYSIINNENFEIINSYILAVNCLLDINDTSIKFKNSKAREIYDKIQRGRQELAKKNKGPDENMNLENIIASVTVQHNSYNLLNIWELTIYQLYDQFARLNRKIQLDISGLRWAAWGTDQFDFSLWYKYINLNKKGD